MKRQSEKHSLTRIPTAPVDRPEIGRDDAPSERRPVSRLGLWVGAAGIFVLVTALVAVTANDFGLTWDEPPYRHSQIEMAKWFGKLCQCRSIDQVKPLLTKDAILESWEFNRFGPNFHPPFAGMLCNLTHAAFEPVLGDLASRRLASGAELALAAAVLFMFLARRYDYWVGGVASASLVLMPRVFGDAHIAGTDMPLMAFWALTALAFWNGLKSRGWRIGFGVLLGLSLLVKFTALLLVVPLVIWLISYRAIPRFSSGGLVAWLLGTAIIAWPLAVVGVEIVRLADGIRLHTQQGRMLGMVVEGTAKQMLINRIAHDPPISSEELQRAAQSLHEVAAKKPAMSLDRLITREVADAASHLNAHDSVERAELDAIGREARDQVFLQFFEHAPPYSETELKRAALQMLEETAGQRDKSLENMVGHEAPFSTAELKQVATELQLRPLALDQYVAYVMPKQDLGVTTRIPGWVFFLPLVMWIAWSLVSSSPLAPAWMRESGGGLRLWLAGIAIAPAVAIALNPTWWNETLPQLAHYYQISVGRQGSLPDIEIFYLGKKYIYSLPWHNGWLLTAVTVPTAILICSIVGLGTTVVNWWRDPLRVFFVLNMLTLPVSRMLPTPAHDGVRLMLPTFFFLAGLAGWGFQLVEHAVERFRSEEYSTAPVLAVAAGFLLAPPAYWMFRTHPFDLSYYNGLVGGLPGAQRLGFEPTYWYDAVTPSVLRDLNDLEHGLPLQATLSLPEPKSILESTLPPMFQYSSYALSLPEPRINPDVFYYLAKDSKLRHRLRPDILLHNPIATDFPYVALLTHSSKASPFTRLLYALKPRASWGHDGVRLFSLYDPPAVARAWALWILLDATDYSKPVMTPRIDHELIELARGNYRALYAAAIHVTQQGIDRALESKEDAETLSVIRHLAARRESLQILLNRRKDALVEAVEILTRSVEKQPNLLERLIESYDGYLPASELGSYLDDGLPGEGRTGRQGEGVTR